MSAAVSAGGIAVAPKALADAVCAHCGQPAMRGRRFCCPGCEAAFETIGALGLGSYYAARVLDPAARPPRPEPADRFDLVRCVTSAPDGTHTLSLAVDGLQCGACVWLIESVLARTPGLTAGRVNMTTRRLKLTWRGAAGEADRLVRAVEALGYRLVPFEPGALAAAQDRAERGLLRALAVAGFASANVMLASVAVWAGLFQDMGPATRTLLHWVSALIAVPAVGYAGMPFFRSALAVLRRRRTNMDVPISVGVVLVTGLSLVQTWRGAEHAYFDSAVMLLFFLLAGRLLDQRARGRARAGAERLLALRGADVAVQDADGTIHRRAAETVPAGARVLVAPGERVGVDGVVVRGRTTLDASLITGESTPLAAGPGAAVFAGTLNLGDAFTLRVTAAGTGTLLAECVRLLEAAESRRGRFVALADRVARAYTPVVHAAALLTFLGWWLGMGAAPGDSLLIACAVLIVTCPCALALAVPAVQVIATERLFGAGVLLKSPTALERLAAVDTVVFDKTGTLTEPTPGLENTPDRDALYAAAALAATSRHPLARALCAAAGAVPPAEGVRESPGQGLSLETPAGEWRLGSRSFAAPGSALSKDAPGPELWFARPGAAPCVFRFAERLRPDAVPTVRALRTLGLEVLLASGDRMTAVRAAADALGIAEWIGGMRPADKVALIERLRAQGRRVLMVGDGLNDAACLAAADVSVSPASAADVTQTTADAVFQGLKLAPVVTLLRTARRARVVTMQNLLLSLVYNALAVPLAVAGFLTPWLAAAAMSGSSLLVIGNSMRVRRVR